MRLHTLLRSDQPWRQPAATANACPHCDEQACWLCEREGEREAAMMNHSTWSNAKETRQ